MNLELTAMAIRVPAPGDSTSVPSIDTPGQSVELPAFGNDPRLDARLPGALRRRIDRFSALAYLAAIELLDSVGERPANERIGLFLANTRAGWSYGEPELRTLVEEGPEQMHAYQATAWFPAAAQGEVSVALGLRGCAKTTSGRHSGLGEALWLARDAIERGAVDLVLVGAAESLVSGFVLRDWDGQQLPVRGPAEGAVLFGLRPTTGNAGCHPVELRHVAEEPISATEEEWVPALGAALRLADALTSGLSTDLTLGGGYHIRLINTPTANHPTKDPEAA